jgi:hypothetical protein
MVVGQLKLWLVVWLAVSMAVGYVCFQRWAELIVLEQQSTFAGIASQPVLEVRKQQQVISKEIELIRERESWLTDRASGESIQILGIISQSTQANQGRVSVQNMELTTVERTIPGPAQTGDGKKPPEPIVEQRTQLDLTGIAIDDLAVASFVAGLRESQVFESVELKSSFGQVYKDQNTREYKVTCIY